MITSRSKWLKQNMQARYKPNTHNFKATIRDLTRTQGEKVYCNNAIMLNQPITAEQLNQRFAQHFGNLHPAVYQYLKNFSHQNGFLYLGRSSVAMQLCMRKLTFSESNASYHFIVCDNGDVLFLERYYLSHLVNLDTGDSLTTDAPLTLCETLSCITSHSGKVQHHFLRESITILREEGMAVFPHDANINYRKRFGVDIEQIETEHQQLMQFLSLYGNLYAEVAKESIKNFGTVNHKTLTNIMLKTYDLYTTPLNDDLLLTKLNNYQQHAQKLQRAGRMKIAASIMLGIAATLLLAVSVAAIVLTFGAVIVPAAIAVALTTITLPGIIAGISATTALAAANTIGVVGLFKRGRSECKLAQIQISTGNAISHDRQQSSRPGNRHA